VDGHAEAPQAELQAAFEYAEQEIEGKGAIGERAKEREDGV